MSKELDKIKKYYGEKMMHMCREMFPRILEDEGALLGILESRFAHNKYLASDIIEQGKTGEFKSFIYSEFDIEAEDNMTSPSQR